MLVSLVATPCLVNRALGSLLLKRVLLLLRDEWHAEKSKKVGLRDQALRVVLPLAVRLAKRALNNVEYMDLKSGYEFEQGLTGELSGYEDFKEAVRAFFEKREPIFKGR